ncbi:protein pxr-1-like [Gossypium hirsutum]|uniref:Protein pxr-1-like n=1 Tax=Gossypium hirsutum TaxID=3635 RepID=A0A1U8MR53_GOSHI|nr:protein pxr-1-like [Gossypium hirsutum]
MAKTRGSVKKATKSTGEHTSSTTTVCETESLRPVQTKEVSDNMKDKESRDIENCLRKIDSLFDDGIFLEQEDTIVEKEVVATEEEVVAEEEKVAKNEKEKEEEDSVGKIVTAPKFVASPTQEATNDAKAEPGTKEQSEDRAKPKKKKRKHSKDKKNERKRRKRGERNIIQSY